VSHGIYFLISIVYGKPINVPLQFDLS